MSKPQTTVISLVSDRPREAICQALLPAMDRALTRQHTPHKRLPITGKRIDWSVGDTDMLSLAIDEVGTSSIVVIASRGPDARTSALRAVNVAADLCVDFAVHTVFLNDAKQPIQAADFLAAGDTVADHGATRTRIVPRKVRLSGAVRPPRRRKVAQLDNWLLTAMRAHVKGITLEEVTRLELEERRAKTVPLRLSAWAISLSTALIAAPLAIPLIVHNLVRGEDLRAGALALGVAGLYAVLAQSGMAPGLSNVL